MQSPREAERDGYKREMLEELMGDEDAGVIVPYSTEPSEKLYEEYDDEPLMHGRYSDKDVIGTVFDLSRTVQKLPGTAEYNNTVNMKWLS